jgi:hypothetical protein
LGLDGLGEKALQGGSLGAAEPFEWRGVLDHPSEELSADRLALGSESEKPYPAVVGVDVALQ